MFRSVCELRDIADGEAKGVCKDENGDCTVFIVRQRDHLFAYRNSCPHAHRPMEYRRDKFLSADGSAIMCFAHAARFEIETGLCVAGPCVGERLTRVECRLRGQTVEIGHVPQASAARPNSARQLQTLDEERTS